MLKKLLLLIIFSLSLSACTIPFLGPKQSALQISASPTASVYLNNNHVGQTPFYDDKLKPGEYTVKVELPDQPEKTWTTTITLSPQIETVINRQFGATPEESSHYLLQLEPIANKNNPEISIITIPDNVIVKVDGQPQGFSPVSLTQPVEGDRTLTLSAPGYQEQTIKAQARNGYKLIISAQLARTPGLDLLPQDTTSATPSADINQANDELSLTPTPSLRISPTPKPTSKPGTSSATGSAELARPYVEILETGTGWLRVRSAPNAATDNEVAKINVGDKFPFIDSNDTGWYQIEYAPGKEGWISGRYAELYR